MSEKLPIFKGYTVDVRLKQFRKLTNEGIIFIDFNSIIGDDLLYEYLETLKPNNKEFKKLINYL